ncbi:hypothetical protein MNBD_GAMMA09-3050 [hydrothermal vent metagenome]|uniref:Crp/Fnr family transcriptional regulator n=1 Tax=hydrothermal vent metagenome TaxID=652676 RepID=A0A3B0XR65_9ZZZZ
MQPSAKLLKEIFEYLPETDQHTLFEFAEFLKSRAPEAVSKVTEPLDIARPEEESVVAAIKRLKLTYPMISQKALLNETSEFMMQHMMHGKSAVDVIDGLEGMFKTYFKETVSKSE